jgi:hypothetical protein
MPDNSLPDDSAQRLALVQQLWRELQAARKDPVKYRSLSERIRRESLLLRSYPPKPES